MVPDRALAEEHYGELSSKPFFPDLIDYIISGPVVAMVSMTAQSAWTHVPKGPLASAAGSHSAASNSVGSGVIGRRNDAAQVWEGNGVVASFRKLVGATDPLKAEPGTVRGDFGRVTGRNIVHASDSPENGERETGEDVRNFVCQFLTT